MQSLLLINSHVVHCKMFFNLIHYKRRFCYSQRTIFMMPCVFVRMVTCTQIASRGFKRNDLKKSHMVSVQGIPSTNGYSKVIPRPTQGAQHTASEKGTVIEDFEDNVLLPGSRIHDFFGSLDVSYKSNIYWTSVRVPKKEGQCLYTCMIQQLSYLHTSKCETHSLGDLPMPLSKI